MSWTDTGGLAAAEQLERSVGPFIALATYQRLIPTLGDADVRTRAILGALRCAVQLGEASEVNRLSALWGDAGKGGHLGVIVPLCKTLAAQGRLDAAAKLAAAEAAREPTARALYLSARCLELTGDSAAGEAFARAAQRADGEAGAEDVGAAARVRLLGYLGADPSQRARALAEASVVDPANASPEERFYLAAARLCAPSRFARASALSILEELGKHPDPRLADAAIQRAAQHADECGQAITAIEADRIAAALRHWRVPEERERALARLVALVRIAAKTGGAREDAILAAGGVAPEIFAHLCRARAVLAGGGQGSYASVAASAQGAAAPAHPAAGLTLAELGLDAIVDMSHDRPREAAIALEQAARKTGGETVIPPPLWTACQLGLAARDAVVQRAAARLAERLLAASRVAPPRGYTSLASALNRASLADLAIQALRAAVLSREPGAPERLGVAIVRRGWELASRGEGEAAITALIEARGMLEPTTPSKPTEPAGPTERRQPSAPPPR